MVNISLTEVTNEVNKVLYIVALKFLIANDSFNKKMILKFGNDYNYSSVNDKIQYLIDFIIISNIHAKVHEKFGSLLDHTHIKSEQYLILTTIHKFTSFEREVASTDKFIEFTSFLYIEMFKSDVPLSFRQKLKNLFEIDKL